jgi:hypothetical protein
MDTFSAARIVLDDRHGRRAAAEARRRSPEGELLPAEWEGPRVCDHLVWAFRVRRDGYSGPKGKRDPDRFVKAAAAISWVAEFVPDVKVRNYLLKWAMAKAERRSVRELERGLGWPRSTTHRNRVEACARIAERLNRHGVPVW